MDVFVVRFSLASVLICTHRSSAELNKARALTSDGCGCAARCSHFWGLFLVLCFGLSPRRLFTCRAITASDTLRHTFARGLSWFYVAHTNTYIALILNHWWQHRPRRQGPFSISVPRVKYRTRFAHVRGHRSCALRMFPRACARKISHRSILHNPR